MNSSAEEFRERNFMLNRFMANKKLPDALRSKILQYRNHLWSRQVSRCVPYSYCLLCLSFVMYLVLHVLASWLYNYAFSFFTSSLQSGVDDEEVLRDLPVRIRSEVEDYLNGPILQKVLFFSCAFFLIARLNT